jgi:hypothetical protein
LEFLLRVTQPFFAAADLDNTFFFAVVFLAVFLVVFFVVAIFKKENNIVFDYGVTKNIGKENKRNMFYLLYAEHAEMNLNAIWYFSNL